MNIEETRALFAAHAMAAIMLTKHWPVEGVAMDAWKQADAMMDEYRRMNLEREKMIKDSNEKLLEFMASQGVISSDALHPPS